ncbi:MAG: agmatine deiminase family protein [Mariniphaga sp.]
MSSTNIVFPAEWTDQSGVMLTWPHEATDWAGMLDEVEICFIAIAKAIAEREKLLIVCPDCQNLIDKLRDCRLENIIFAEFISNDTWARDHGAITVMIDEKPVLYDFTFNGWGMKFTANLDDQITSWLYHNDFFSDNVHYSNQKSLVLEGGSLESDGEGTLLTTKECLLSINRNQHLSEKEIEQQLTELFGLKQVLWLSSGFLSGDDTDSHIDTLARFCDPQTIAYVKCDDIDDEHFEALNKMEQELAAFLTLNQQPYHLISLPMADPVSDGEQRLPATYANFLIINKAVLVPFYDSPKDKIAAAKLQKAFPDREIIGINCLPLIMQHGSLHCVTMQFPDGVF